MTTKEILQIVAENYDGTMAFGSGHGSQLEPFVQKTKNPVLWLLSNESLARVQRLQQGLYRFEGAFLIALATRDRSSGKTTASPQADNLDIEFTCDQAEAIARQMAYTLQYDYPNVGYTNFQWSTRRTQMTTSGLVSGVMVSASFNIKSAECLTMFFEPNNGTLLDELSNILTDELNQDLVS